MSTSTGWLGTLLQKPNDSGDLKLKTFAGHAASHTTYWLKEDQK